MARLPQAFIDQVLNRTDIVDLVDRRVKLKKAGKNYSACCPFHQEKTPSFYVHPQKGLFNCFSSGEKGDGITFIQKLENLDFYEAVEYLSREFNIPLRFQEGTSPSQSHGQSVRKGLFTIQEMAKNWFLEQFNRSGSEYDIAKEY